MAKLFITLILVVVVLNGLTFLMVVNQEGGGSSAGAGTEPATPGATAPDPVLLRIESQVKGMSTSLNEVNRKVADLNRSVTALTLKVNQAASAAAAAPAPSRTLRPVSPIRTAPAEMSRTPAQDAGAGAAPAEDEADPEMEGGVDGAVEGDHEVQPEGGAGVQPEGGEGEVPPEEQPEGAQ